MSQNTPGAKKVVFHLREDLVANSMDGVLDAFKAAIHDGDGDFVLDFKDVEMMDSRGMGGLITLNKLLQTQGRGLFVKNAAVEIVELLKATRLDHHLTIL